MSSGNETGWDDVRGAAAEMFRIWEDGTELDWAEEAWGHLHRAGLVGGDTAMQITATHLRLLTLARIYQEFCGYVWEENPDTPVLYLAENLEIDPVALGILAALQDAHRFDEIEDDDELRELALIVATDGQRLEIASCLKQAYGGSEALYSRLWHTRSAEAEEDSEDDEFVGSSANSFGLNFVMNDFLTV